MSERGKIYVVTRVIFVDTDIACFTIRELAEEFAAEKSANYYKTHQSISPNGIGIPSSEYLYIRDKYGIDIYQSLYQQLKGFDDQTANKIYIECGPFKVIEAELYA